MIKKGSVSLALIFVLGAVFCIKNAFALFPAEDGADKAPAERVIEELKNEKALIASETCAEKEKAEEKNELLVSRIKEQMEAGTVPQKSRAAKPGMDLRIIIFAGLAFIGFYFINKLLKKRA